MLIKTSLRGLLAKLSGVYVTDDCFRYSETMRDNRFLFCFNHIIRRT